MSRRLIQASLILVLLVAPARAQTPFGTQSVPSRTALARIGLERQWLGTMGVSGTERLIEISISGDLLFAQTNFANFSVFHAETGQYLWSIKLGTRTGNAHPASANSFAVFVTNGDQLFAIHRQTGRPLWIQQLEALPSGPTSCSEDLVTVGLTSGKLVAYGLKVKADKGEPRLSNKAIRLWNWQTGGPITARALPSGAIVAFGSLDHRVYVVTSELPATPLYRFATGDEVSAPLGTYGTRLLLIPSADKNVYGIDLWTAHPKWIFSSGAPVRQEPVVADNDAYVVNTSGALSAVDVNTGEARWTTSTHGGRLVSISASRVYLETHDDDLFIVDRASGNMVLDPRSTYQRAGVNLREFSLGITNDVDDRMYFATPSGLILCLREAAQVAPRLLRDPKAKPFGYIPPEGIKLPRPGETIELPSPLQNQEPAAPGEEKTEPKEQEKEKDAAPGEEKDKDMPAADDKAAAEPK